MVPFVTVIIPVYKEWQILSRCIDALAQQTYGIENFEVIVVNNDKPETVPSTVSLPSFCRVLSEPKPGSYAARNTGIGAAKGTILAFTDADCEPHSDWIKNGVAFLLQHPAYSRVAGPVKIMQNGNKPTLVERYNQIYAFPQVWLIKHGGGSVTANLLVYKSVFDKVGGFDEKLLSMGDKHWGMKAEAAGFKIAYQENVAVSHPPRDLAELIRKEKRHAGAIEAPAGKSKLRMYINFLYDCRPRFSGLRYMLGRGKGKTLRDRVGIPLLRHYLVGVRRYEALQIGLGRRKPSRV